MTAEFRSAEMQQRGYSPEQIEQHERDWAVITAATQPIRVGTYGITLELPGQWSSENFNRLALNLGEPSDKRPDILGIADPHESAGMNWLATVPDYVHVLPPRYGSRPTSYQGSQEIFTNFDFVSDRPFFVGGHKAQAVRKGDILPRAQLDGAKSYT